MKGENWHFQFSPKSYSPSFQKKNGWNKSVTGSKSLHNVVCKELEHKDTNVDLKISL